MDISPALEQELVALAAQHRYPSVEAYLRAVLGLELSGQDGRLYCELVDSADLRFAVAEGLESGEPVLLTKQLLADIAREAVREDTGQR